MPSGSSRKSDTTRFTLYYGGAGTQPGKTQHDAGQHNRKDDITRAAWAYLFVTLVAFLVLCLVMGHPVWFFTIFYENTVSDLTGQQPIGAAYGLLAEAIRGDVSGAADVLVSAVHEDLPSTVQFVSIDGLVVSVVLWFDKRHRAAGASPDRDTGLTRRAALVTFVAGYFLQAIVALGWSGGLSLNAACNYFMEHFFDVLLHGTILIGIALWVYGAFIKGEQDLSRIHGTVNVLMAVVAVIFFQVVKSFIVTYAYVLLVAVVGVLFGATGYFPPLVFIWSVAVPLCLCAVNRRIDRGAELLTGHFAREFDREVGFRRSLGGDVLCCLIAVLFTVSCFLVRMA